MMADISISVFQLTGIFGSEPHLNIIIVVTVAFFVLNDDVAAPRGRFKDCANVTLVGCAQT
jgi:hypothetical protein